MVFEFEGQAIEWRRPAPFVFVPVPGDISAEIKAVSNRVTYGWGVIPCLVRIGQTEFKTSLFPRNGVYLVPVKVHVQRAEAVAIGDRVKVEIELSLGAGLA